jgi:hypothetical protein
MTTLRTFGFPWVWLLLLLPLLSVAPSAAEDIPAFEGAFGWPAIEPAPDQSGPNCACQFPAIAADESRVYVGLRQIDVYSRDGEWLDFYPFSSPIRGVGDLEWGSNSRVTDLALGGTDRLFVLDRGYAAVHVYSRDGTFIRGWGGRGDAPEDLADPRAICVSDDGSVYVLDCYPARIVHFDADGQFLNAWATPVLPEPYDTTADDIAPAPGGGVWVVIDARYYGETPEQSARETRLHRYGPDGIEVTNWQIETDEYDYDLQIETDSAGNVWVSGTKLRRFTPDGTLLAEMDGPWWTHEFCIAPDSQVLYLGATQLTLDYYYRDIVCDVKVMGFDGQAVGGFGSHWAADDVGMLWRPWGLAVALDGTTYTKSEYGDSYTEYLFRFGADGGLLESLVTDQHPIYNPATQAVELLDRYANFFGPAGAYMLTVSDIYWVPPDERGTNPDGYGVVELQILPDRTVFARLRAPEAPEGFWEDTCWTSACSQLRSGDIVLAMIVDSSGVGDRLLWVATLTLQGELIRSVLIQDPSCDWFPCNVTLDDGGAIYIAGNGVWKFSPSGIPIGRIDGWGGEGDQRDAPGSLTLTPSGVNVDPAGRVRVLDWRANRVLTFAYTPAPFPDVPYYYWAKDAVRAAVAAGVVTGHGNGDYAPTQAVHRDEMAVFVARALAGGEANIPPGPAEETFLDVPPDYWAYDHIEYCADSGVVAGIAEGQYGPAQIVDRAQTAVYIARAKGWVALSDDMSTAPELFPDVPAGYWAGTAIQACVQNNVVQGYGDGNYGPEVTVSRDQMAVFVTRAFRLAL